MESGTLTDITFCGTRINVKNLCLTDFRANKKFKSDFWTRNCDTLFVVAVAVLVQVSRQKYYLTLHISANANNNIQVKGIQNALGPQNAGFQFKVIRS